MNRILVLGSTGKTGSRIYQKLKSSGADVRGASRSNTTPFNWERDETWPAVLSGIDTVYVSFQPHLAIPAALDCIERFVQLAKKAGVQKLVLLSGRGEREAMACENVIIQSGLQWTILRASFFMQNFSEGFWTDGILAGEFVIPAIQTKEPFVDTDDIADVAVEVLTNDAHDGKVYELTGPELLSFKSITDKITARTGRHINHIEVTLEEYAAMLKAYDVPDDAIWLIRYLFTEVLDGRNESVKTDIEEVLKRKASSFDDYITKCIKSNVWSQSDAMVPIPMI